MSSSLKLLLLFSLIIIILCQPQICYDYCAPNGCNCYKIFGVGTNAPLNEIKQIYRALSFQYHPDVNPGKDTNAQFAQIASCYEILKDSRSRAQYNDCMRYDQSHYVPKSNHDSLLSLAIPIISILVNIFRRRGAQGEQAGQATSIWKKILKGLGYIIVPIVLYYGVFGEYTFFIILIGMWSKGLIKKTIQKIWSFVNKGSIEDEIKNFLTELRKALDMNQERIDQELSRKRKAKEDEINLGKNQEMEILQRYHNENVSFIGGKPEDKEENDETRALLKSEKEVELEKTLNRNVQLCESRYSEKIKKLEEDFNGFVEKYKRNFESYREFISDFEKNIEIKIKEKKASRKELKEELQAMKKALETKLMAGEKIEQKDDKKE